MSSNTAAIFTGDISSPSKLIEVKELPYPTAQDDQIIIKSKAFAANPTDWKQLYFGFSPAGAITGSDVSGEVVSVGSKVTGFAKGDYVSSFVQGNVSDKNGAFAEYVIGDPLTTIKYSSKFPSEALSVGDHEADKINSFESAASVTLGLTTVGVSFAGNLAISSTKTDNEGKYILIWGGATATGVLAIQIAKLIYGLKVITTASPKNFEFLKSLGADEVYNYRDSSSLEQLAKYDFSYAFDTVSEPESFQQLYSATKNSKHVRIDNLLFLAEKDITKDDRSGEVVFVPGTLAYMAVGREVKAYGNTWKFDDETFKRFQQFWFEILPKYIPELKSSNLKVLKPGYESAVEAFQLLKEGKVSGEKVVFRA